MLPFITPTFFNPRNALFVQTFTANTNVAVPYGAQWATIGAWGGGGGGDKGSVGGGSGGSGGGACFTISTVDLVGRGVTSFDLIIGKGGAGKITQTFTNSRGSNTVVRLNGTDLIVAGGGSPLSGSDGGTTTVITFDYANASSYWLSTRSQGGSGVAGASSTGYGSGGGAAGSDKGTGGQGVFGDDFQHGLMVLHTYTVTSSAGGLFNGVYKFGQTIPSGNAVGGDRHSNPPTATYGGGGGGGDANNQTISSGGPDNGLVMSQTAGDGGNGAVVIYWGDPSYWFAPGGPHAG